MFLLPRLSARSDQFNFIHFYRGQALSLIYIVIWYIPSFVEYINIFLKIERSRDFFLSVSTWAWRTRKSFKLKTGIFVARNGRSFLQKLFSEFRYFFYKTAVYWDLNNRDGMCYYMSLENLVQCLDGGRKRISLENGTGIQFLIHHSIGSVSNWG